MVFSLQARGNTSESCTALFIGNGSSLKAKIYSLPILKKKSGANFTTHFINKKPVALELQGLSSFENIYFLMSEFFGFTKYGLFSLMYMDPNGEDKYGPRLFVNNMGLKNLWIALADLYTANKIGVTFVSGEINVKYFTKSLVNAFPNTRFKFLTLKMSQAERDAIMLEYKSGKIQHIVAETGVEDVFYNVQISNIINLSPYALAKNQFKELFELSDKATFNQSKINYVQFTLNMDNVIELIKEHQLEDQKKKRSSYREYVLRKRQSNLDQKESDAQAEELRKQSRKNRKQILSGLR